MEARRAPLKIWSTCPALLVTLAGHLMPLFRASRASTQHDSFLTQLCWAQVNMQAVVLVSVFRQQTRDKLIEYIEWCLPDRIPWLWDYMGYRQTPAQMVHSAIVSKISAFQAGVARRQSAAHSDHRYNDRRQLVTPSGSCNRRPLQCPRCSSSSPRARRIYRCHCTHKKRRSCEWLLMDPHGCIYAGGSWSSWRTISGA